MQHRAWLLAQAKKMCRNESDAEDLVQDAILRFIKHYDEAVVLPDRDTCASWLITTLTNLFYDQCRRRKVRTRNEKELVLHERTQVDLEPAEMPLSQTTTPEQVEEGVRTVLSPTMQDTYRLYRQEMPYRDIARSQGLKLGTVSKRVHDIHKKLRAFLSTRVN
ncbi:hypothetical protein MFUL124B02_12855 [Myxococcus fulvus 124B02]|nr:hypothetical protein MFUL124B02_12855 [Myxococcus fulvus 124B02]